MPSKGATRFPRFKMFLPLLSDATETTERQLPNPTRSRWHQVEMSKHKLRLSILEDVLHYHPDCKGLIQPTVDATTAATIQCPLTREYPSATPQGPSASNGIGSGVPGSSIGAVGGRLPAASPAVESKGNANVVMNGGGAMNASTASASTAASGDGDSQVFYFICVCRLFSSEEIFRESLAPYHP